MCIAKYKIRRGLDSFVRNWGADGKKSVFAPCGHCEDCKSRARYAWAWRLTADLQYYIQHKGYKCGFITLTYNDESLPRIPSCYENLAGMPCFSRAHTQNFVLYVRKKLHEFYGISNVLYFLSSENGEHTDRPHYHFLVAWDASKATPEQVHEVIRHYWADDFVSKLTKKITRKAFGFVCPATPQGGERKRDGKIIKPFEVKSLNDSMLSAFYTAKYVTKDASFMRKIYDKVTREEYKELKEYFPHHRQKKSLGFDSVACLSDAEKIDLMSRGRCFLGSDRLMLPPLYIQRKLLFKPCYIIDSDFNRLVREKATDFYYRNYDLITDKKVSYYDTLFKSMRDKSYWTNSGCPDDIAENVSAFVDEWLSAPLFGCSAGAAYVHYFGMPYDYCYIDPKLTDMMRYHYWFPEKMYMFQNFTYSGLRIDRFDYYNIQNFFNTILGYMQWEPIAVANKDADFVRDFYNKLSANGE